MNNIPSKRGRFSSHITLGDTNNPINAEGRYVVIKSEQCDAIKKLSPFVIQKSVESISTLTDKTSRMKDGSLLILTKSKQVAVKFLALKTFAGLNVTVSEHSSLNYVKGIIFCNDIVHMDESEILNELKNQFVTSVYRLKKVINHEFVPTPGLILTFDLHKIPDEIKIGYLSVRVRLYIPNPLKCYNCFAFGHKKAKCQEKHPVCGICSTVGVHSPCGSPHCLNCKGNHTNFDKNCPVFQEEKNITKIQTIDRLSYGAAKRIYTAEYKNTSQTYADATKNSYSNHQSSYLEEINQLKLLIEETNRSANQRQSELLEKLELFAHETAKLKIKVEQQNKQISDQQQIIDELQKKRSTDSPVLDFPNQQDIQITDDLQNQILSETPVFDFRFAAQNDPEFTYSMRIKEIENTEDEPEENSEEWNNQLHKKRKNKQLIKKLKKSEILQLLERK